MKLDKLVNTSSKKTTRGEFFEEFTRVSGTDVAIGKDVMVYRELCGNSGELLKWIETKIREARIEGRSEGWWVHEALSGIPDSVANMCTEKEQEEFLGSKDFSDYWNQLVDSILR